MSKKLQILFLPIVCLVLGIALAGIYNLTAPVIEENEKKRAEEARKEVLAAADEFTIIEKELNDFGISECHKANNGAGATFKMKTKGYGGEIFLMVGIDKEGKVAGVKILEHSETPGLGAKTEKPKFLEQFNGKQGELNVVKNNPNNNDIVAVTGATTSSKAVTKAVNNALAAYEQIKGDLK